MKKQALMLALSIFVGLFLWTMTLGAQTIIEGNKDIPDDEILAKKSIEVIDAEATDKLWQSICLSGLNSSLREFLQKYFPYLGFEAQVMALNDFQSPRIKDGELVLTECMINAVVVMIENQELRATLYGTSPQHFLTEFYSILHVHLNPNGELDPAQAYIVPWTPLWPDGWKSGWCGFLKGLYPGDFEKEGCVQ